MEIPESVFIEEAQRIVSAAKEQKFNIRLLGALAFRLHCPKFGYIQKMLDRKFTDIDFAARSKDVHLVRKFFTGMGFAEDIAVSTLYGSGRLIFNDKKTGLHCDIFIDKLDFCHQVVFKDRLDVDPLTIPIAELILEKMQIVKINEKDIIDTIMILREHAVGDNDDETVNASRISMLTANDWGLWRTVTSNLQKVRNQSRNYPKLDSNDIDDVDKKIGEILNRIENYPKPVSWKLRNKIGDKLKWYKEVDDLN